MLGCLTAQRSERVSQLDGLSTPIHFLPLELLANDIRPEQRVFGNVHVFPLRYTGICLLDRLRPSLEDMRHYDLLKMLLHPVPGRCQ